MPKNHKKQQPWDLPSGRKVQTNPIPLRKRYLICTEGKSEAVYFKHYRSSTGPIVLVIDQSDHKVSLVNKTIDKRSALISDGNFDEKTDETWVVFDRDIDAVNKKDLENFNRAIDLAKQSNILVAYSNDSFELFPLLHFIDLKTGTHRKDLYKKLSTYLKRKYQHGDDLYKEIEHARSTAIKRAKNLLELADKNPNVNPSTTVHILVEKLLAQPGKPLNYD